MINTTYITYTICILCISFVVVFAISALIVFHLKKKKRAKVLAEAENKPKTVKYALAGDEHDNGHHGCHKFETTLYGLKTFRFEDANGNPLELEKHDLYVADGGSMKFCGINPNDLVFAKRLSFESEIHFPLILILKKRTETKGEPNFKIRRAWRRTTYVSDEELLKVIEELLKSEEFLGMKDKKEYLGDDWIIEDFKKTRLSNYHTNYLDKTNCPDKDKDIIISSTLNTKDNEIHLSIHPIGCVVGKVVASFTLPKEVFEKPENI